MQHPHLDLALSLWQATSESDVDRLIAALRDIVVT